MIVRTVADFLFRHSKPFLLSLLIFLATGRIHYTVLLVVPRPIESIRHFFSFLRIFEEVRLNPGYSAHFRFDHRELPTVLHHEALFQ